jgi:1,4-dihydroxy-2-naphthoate polyprenyltransferase
MSRPSHLALILAVAVMGGLAAIAGGGEAGAIRVSVAAICLLLVAASAHYLNEWADHETDALTSRTPFSGGSGALQRTGLPRQLALGAAVVMAIIASALATLALATGWLLPVAGLLLAVGGILAWAYSLPPIALAWRGLGEADNALVGGLLLPLYGYAVVAGELSTAVVVAFVPFAAIDFSNLLATTWADRHADAAVGKRTLATRWPIARLRLAHAAASAATVILLVSLTALGTLPPLVGVAGMAALPVIGWASWRYTRQESPTPSVVAMLSVGGLMLLGWAATTIGAA